MQGRRGGWEWGWGSSGEMPGGRWGGRSHVATAQDGRRRDTGPGGHRALGEATRGGGEGGRGRGGPNIRSAPGPAPGAFSPAAPRGRPRTEHTGRLVRCARRWPWRGLLVLPKAGSPGLRGRVPKVTKRCVFPQKNCRRGWGGGQGKHKQSDGRCLEVTVGPGPGAALTCSGLGTTKGMRASMGTTHGEMVVAKLFPRNGPSGTYSHL